MVNHTQNPPLSTELSTLKVSLRIAKKALKNNPDDPQKAGLLIAHLTNSIARLTLAQQKLQLSPTTTLEAEWDSALRAFGLDEQV